MFFLGLGENDLVGGVASNDFFVFLEKCACWLAWFGKMQMLRLLFLKKLLQSACLYGICLIENWFS